MSHHWINHKEPLWRWFTGGLWRPLSLHTICRDAVRLGVDVGPLLRRQLKRMLCCHHWDSPASPHCGPTHRVKAAIAEQCWAYIIAAGAQAWLVDTGGSARTSVPALLPDSSLMSTSSHLVFRRQPRTRAEKWNVKDRPELESRLQRGGCKVPSNILTFLISTMWTSSLPC